MLRGSVFVIACCCGGSAYSCRSEGDFFGRGVYGSFFYVSGVFHGLWGDVMLPILLGVYFVLIAIANLLYSGENVG